MKETKTKVRSVGRMPGTQITIKVLEHDGRFGRYYTAANSYGEPKVVVKGFMTVDEAFENEVAELQRMLS